MKRTWTGIIGGTVLLIGIALLVLPGPGIPIVVAGLAILGSEFLWARRALRNAKGAVAKLQRRTGLAAWWRRRTQASRNLAGTGSRKQGGPSVLRNPNEVQHPGVRVGQAVPNHDDSDPKDHGDADPGHPPMTTNVARDDIRRDAHQGHGEK